MLCFAFDMIPAMVPGRCIKTKQKFVSEGEALLHCLGPIIEL